MVDVNKLCNCNEQCAVAMLVQTWSYVVESCDLNAIVFVFLITGCRRHVW